MPKYATVVDGIQGLGTTTVNPPAQAQHDPQTRLPEDPAIAWDQPTGGTYTGGMLVTREIRDQIQQSSASDFYSFTRATDEPEERYEMRPKLPEHGCAGPGQPVFKLRENNNRLMKGVAQKFLGEDGEPDIEKGMAFLQEWDVRFGLKSGEAYSPEMPLERDPSVLKQNAHDWLCDELQIPHAERADFKNYLDASVQFEGTPGAINKSNFHEIWSNFGRNYLAMQEMKREAGKPPAGPDDPAPEWKDSEIYQRNLRGFEAGVDELKRLAAIDPVQETSMIVPNECSGSQIFNTQYMKLADQANIAAGRRSPDEVRSEPEAFVVSQVDDIRNARRETEEIWDRIKELKEQVEKEESEEKITELTQQIGVLSDWYADLKPIADRGERQNDLKLDYHQAAVLGSFTTGEGEDKKTWYLTAEAFAPETDTMVEHPGITNGVASGIYSGPEDFQNYYRKAAPFVDVNSPGVTSFIKEKEERSFTAANAIADLEAITIDSVAAQREKKGIYSGSYAQVKQELNGQTDPAITGCRENLRTLQAMKSGIPQDQQEQFDRFLAASEDFLNRTDTLDRARKTTEALVQTTEKNLEGLQTMKMNVGNRRGDQSALLDSIQAEIDDAERTHRELSEVLQAQDQRNGIPEKNVAALNDIAGKLSRGERLDFNSMEPEQETLYRGVIQKMGFAPEQFESFVNTVSAQKQPPREMNVDVRSATPEAAESFLGKNDVMQMSGEDLQFARHNLDPALNAVFPEAERNRLQSMHQDIYDYIYIDGINANEHFSKQFEYQAGERTEDLKKAEIMRCLMDGHQVDVARENAGGQIEILPVRLSSQIPAVAEIAGRQADAQRMDFREAIEADQMQFSNRYAPVAKEVVFHADAGMKHDVFDELQRAARGELSQAEKEQLGKKMLDQLVGSNLTGPDGFSDLHQMEAAMSHVMINGIPFTSTLKNGFTQRGYRDALSQLVDRVSTGMQETKTPNGYADPLGTVNVSILDENNKMVPVTYTPPEPVPPKTRVALFGRRREQRAAEEAAYQDAVQRKAHWAQRNADAQSKNDVYDSMRSQTFEATVHPDPVAEERHRYFTDLGLSQPPLEASKQPQTREISFSEMMNRMKNGLEDKEHEQHRRQQTDHRRQKQTEAHSEHERSAIM